MWPPFLKLVQKDQVQLDLARFTNSIIRPLLPCDILYEQNNSFSSFELWNLIENFYLNSSSP